VVDIMGWGIGMVQKGFSAFGVYCLLCPCSLSVCVYISFMFELTPNADVMSNIKGNGAGVHTAR
jgi:hypothetical protein